MTTENQMQPNAILEHFAANVQGIDLSTPSRIVNFGAQMLDGTFGMSLYIRDVYLHLWKAIEKSNMWGVVLSGDPGIGKSHWLLWLLIWLVQHGHKVIWHGRQTSGLYVYIFEGNVVRTLTADEAEQELVNGDMYYLIDRNEPFDFPGMQPIKAVGAHSPDPDACRMFMKQNRGVDKRRWYMPPLEEEEVIEMCLAFPSVTEETALARYYVYGGCARAIFDDAACDDDYNIKNHALAKLTWPMVANAGGAPTRMDDISSVLFTIQVPNWEEGDFHTTEPDFASRQMRKAVYKICRERYGPQFFAFMRTGSPDFAAQYDYGASAGFAAACRSLGITNPEQQLSMIEDTDLEQESGSAFEIRTGVLDDTSVRGKGSVGRRCKKPPQALHAATSRSAVGVQMRCAGRLPKRSGPLLYLHHFLPSSSRLPQLF